MEKILEKISSYHIFNNLVPGYLFLIISSKILEKSLIMDNIIYSFFQAYFIGVIISRISSLIIGNAIKKIWKLKRESYGEYIKACKKDDKIEILNQDCNMYRSLCTLMIIEFILKILVVFKIQDLINKNILFLLILILLIIVFARSYVKQSNFISLRVKEILKEKK